MNASNTLDFFYQHEVFQPIFVHCFSVGNYVWSALMKKILQNMEKYESVLFRIKGQVFDSPPTKPPFSQRGMAIALFPQNTYLQYLFGCVIKFQQFLFYNFVTKHMLESYEAFLNPPTKSPILMFISKDDPIAPYEQLIDVYKNWKNCRMKAIVKYWDRSPHVGHFVHHRKEYIEQLNSFLDSVCLNNLAREKNTVLKV